MDGQPDIDRPLNTRGYNDSHRMAKEFIESNPRPQVFVSSPAIRAISTALIFAGEFDLPKSEIRIEPTLYDTDAEDYLNFIRSLDEKTESVMIFGHNPSISDFYTLFSDQFLEIPTCSMVVFEVSASKWSEISPMNCKVKELRTPKKQAV